MNNLDLLIPVRPESGERWTWATVINGNPLRIRLDGDEDPLDITPDCLYAEPVAGQRVWAQLVGRRVIVHAPTRGGASADGTVDGNADAVATFTFAVPSKSWLMTHNLNDPAPTVVLKDTTGAVCVGDISYIDKNTVHVDWYFPMAGSAIVSV